MKVNIWVAVIVLVVGLWDLYYAYNRYQEFEQKNKKMVESMKDIIAICDL